MASHTSKITNFPNLATKMRPRPQETTCVFQSGRSFSMTPGYATNQPPQNTSGEWPEVGSSDRWSDPSTARTGGLTNRRQTAAARGILQLPRQSKSGRKHWGSGVLLPQVDLPQRPPEPKATESNPVGLAVSTHKRDREKARLRETAAAPTPRRTDHARPTGRAGTATLE